jgi:hypothetical protein
MRKERGSLYEIILSVLKRVFSKDGSGFILIGLQKRNTSLK